MFAICTILTLAVMISMIDGNNNASAYSNMKVVLWCFIGAMAACLSEAISCMAILPVGLIPSWIRLDDNFMVPCISGAVLTLLNIYSPIQS